MTERRILVVDGGTAEIVETDGTAVVLRASVASPPGSTLAGRIHGEERAYRVKVRGCRRLDQSALPFRIEGRFVDLTREQRDRIAKRDDP